MLKKCAHHGLPNEYLLHIFYGGLFNSNKKQLDDICHGSFMDITAKHAWKFLNEIYKLSVSDTIETKNAGPIKLDPECVATFSKTGEIKDLLGNLELGDETLVEIYSLFSKYMQEPAKKEKTKSIAYEKDKVKVAKKEPAK